MVLVGYSSDQGSRLGWYHRVTSLWLWQKYVTEWRHLAWWVIFWWFFVGFFKLGSNCEKIYLQSCVRCLFRLFWCFLMIYRWFLSVRNLVLSFFNGIVTIFFFRICTFMFTLLCFDLHYSKILSSPEFWTVLISIRVLRFLVDVVEPGWRPEIEKFRSDWLVPGCPPKSDNAIFLKSASG